MFMCMDTKTHNLLSFFGGVFYQFWFKEMKTSPAWFWVFDFKSTKVNASSKQEEHISIS